MRTTELSWIITLLSSVELNRICWEFMNFATSTVLLKWSESIFSWITTKKLKLKTLGGKKYSKSKSHQQHDMDKHCPP